MQHALASYLQDPPPYLRLPDFYQAKRDFFRRHSPAHGSSPCPARTLFQCGVDIRAVSDLSEPDFCQWLTREMGVAAIPLSAFYSDGFDQGVVRFCFAKQEATLAQALERLARL